MATKKRSTPDVYRTEKDISNTVVPVSTSIGAVVVRSKKGPINRPVIITSDSDYVDIFGEPVFTSGNATDATIPEMGYGQYAAIRYARESDAVYVLRDYDTGDTYSYLEFESNGSTSATETSGVQATSNPDSIPDEVDSIYTLDEAITTGSSLLVGAIGPGTDGNNIAITVETFNSACDWINLYDDYSVSVESSAHPIASKVFKIQVFTKKDSEDWDEIAFSAISASPVETFYGTRTSQKDANNQQLRIEDVINGNSNYIYVVAGTADFTEAGTLATTPSSVSKLLGGSVVYGTNLGSTDGWDYFSSRERTSQNIMIVPDYDMTVKKYVANICATRKDCICTLQSGNVSATSVDRVKSAETYGYTNPSYVALYSGWDKFYDNYNDRFVLIPKAIYGAVLMARTDAVANTWDAPAGVNRGILDSNGQNIQWTSTQVGQLYDANINTSINKRGIGDVMLGQKTAQLKASALDRINVRRLLIFIENTLEQAYLSFLFEPNNSATRLRLKNISDSFLEGVSAGGGFNTDNDAGFLVVCDETKNTAQVIDENKLVVQVFVKPSKTAEFIELETIITNSGVSFNELI